MLVHAGALLDGTLQLQPPVTPAPGPSPEPLLPPALIAISVIGGPPAGSVKLCPAAVRPVKVVPVGVVLSSSVQTLLCWVSEVTPLRVVCVGLRTLSLV